MDNDSNNIFLFYRWCYELDEEKGEVVIESWMVSAGMGVVTLVFGYGMFKNKVQTLEEWAKKHEELDTLFHSDLERKMSAQFRRIDDNTNDITEIKAKNINNLNIERAEEKFVSKDELSLHLRNIETQISHMNKSSETIVGKLEDLTKAFSSYMLREINDEK